MDSPDRPLIVGGTSSPIDSFNYESSAKYIYSVNSEESSLLKLGLRLTTVEMFWQKIQKDLQPAVIEIIECLCSDLQTLLTNPHERPHSQSCLCRDQGSPHFLQMLTRDLTVNLVFAEIMGVIKGSPYFSQMLTRDLTVNLVFAEIMGVIKGSASIERDAASTELHWSL